MPSDSSVTAQAILRALANLKRQGSARVMQNLEEVEPELLDFTLEELTGVYHDILGLGGPRKASRGVYQRVQTLVLVAITSLRASHYELWRQEASGSRLSQLDSSLAPEQPPRDGDEPPPPLPPPVVPAP